MKISKIMMLFVAILLLVVTNDVFSQTKNKTGATLQHPYNFTYDVSVNDSCCIDIKITAPPHANPLEHQYHAFKVIINNVVYKDYYPFEDRFTYGRVYETTICPPDTTLEFKLKIEIICDCSTEDPDDDHLCDTSGMFIPFRQTITLPCNNKFLEGCCIRYYLDPDKSGDSLIFGPTDENGNFYDNSLVERRKKSEIGIDPITGLKFVDICPDYNELPIFNYKVTYKTGNNYGATITKSLKTPCCHCKADEMPAFKIIPVEDPDSTCLGCKFKLDYTSRNYIPDWIDCYDSINIKVWEWMSTIIKQEQFDLSNFDPEVFGEFCFNDTIPGRIEIKYIKNQIVPLGSSSCEQTILFDCNGMIADSTHPPTDDNGPCTPDCDSVAWKGPETMPYPDMPTQYMGYTADVTAEYYYRDACGFQDIQITKLAITIKPSDPPLPADLRSKAEEKIYAKMIEKIIYVNKMQFKPKDEDLKKGAGSKCDTTWRVTMGSCWAEVPYSLIPQPNYNDIVFKPKYTGDFGTNNLILFADPLLDAHFKEFPTDMYLITNYKKRCENAECCVQQFKVCKLRNDLDSIEQRFFPLDSVYNFVDCLNVFTTYVNWLTGFSYLKKCDPMCDWLSQLIPLICDPSTGKISILNNNSDYIKYNIKDYFGKNEVRISMEFDSEAEVEVIFFNTSGQYMETKKFTSTKGTNNITINTSDYNTGAYFYTIIINNKMIKSNKFIITK